MQASEHRKPGAGTLTLVRALCRHIRVPSAGSPGPCISQKGVGGSQFEVSALEAQIQPRGAGRAPGHPDQRPPWGPSASCGNAHLSRSCGPGNRPGRSRGKPGAGLRRSLRSGTGSRRTGPRLGSSFASACPAGGCRQGQARCSLLTIVRNPELPLGEQRGSLRHSPSRCTPRAGSKLGGRSV